MDRAKIKCTKPLTERNSKRQQWSYFNKIKEMNGPYQHKERSGISTSCRNCLWCEKIRLYLVTRWFIKTIDRNQHYATGAPLALICGK